ncbi:MAG: DinB family protein [Longimicrobiales bacterium]
MVGVGDCGCRKHHGANGSRHCDRRVESAHGARGASQERGLASLGRKHDDDQRLLAPDSTRAILRDHDRAFGQYPGRVYDLLLYAIDNEIHRRGQGYVYLRAQDIEPPPFYDRQ